MTQPENGRAPWPRAAAEVARGTVMSLYQHWALGLFSLAAAFAIWFVIQDVENPRVQAAFPAEEDPGIEVTAINADKLIPDREYRVKVDIEGREDDLQLLAPEDFAATIDVKGIPARTATEVPVKVTTSVDGVRVLKVTPATVSVTLEEVAEAEKDVRLNPTGQLPAGFTVRDFKVEPLTVKVSGLRDLVSQVASVDLDVNLGALREGTSEIEGELTARSATGSSLRVALSPARAKVTYTIDQTFVQRTLPVAPVLSGQLAPGYRITNIVVEPPAVSVSGLANEMPAELTTEPIQLTNANSEIRLVRNINAGNLSLERRQVTVRIDVKPIECTAGTAGTPCGAAVIPVAAVPTDVPPGLAILTSPLRVYVQLTGPLTVLDAIPPGQITARVSLAGAQAGSGAFPVTVVMPATLTNQGVRAEPPGPMSITLGTGP